MVKSPGPKHSKPRKEPVTIDLDPKDVERKPGEAKPSADTAPSKPDDGAIGTSPNTGEKSASTGAGEAKADPVAPAGDTRSQGSGPAQAEPAASPSVSQAKAAAGGPESTKAGSAASPSAASKAQSDAGTTSDGSKANHKDGAGAERKASGPAVPPSGAGGAGGMKPPSDTRGTASARPGRGTALLAGLAGGLIALLLVAVLQWAGMWPVGTAARGSGEVAELRMQIDELRQAMADDETGATSEDIDARIGEAVEASVAPLRDELASLQADLPDGSGEAADLQPLQERLDAVESALATIGDGSPDGLQAEADERLAALETRVEAIEAGAGQDDELAARMDGLEQELAAVRTEMGERADEPRAALVIAASALKMAIDRGDGFQSELETYASLAPDAESVASLGAFAEAGVPTRSAILADLPAAADRMVAAGRARDEGADFLGNLWQSARDLVAVRPIGAIEGDSTEAIVARLEAAVREGEYGTALSEYEALPAAAQSAGADYMEGVRARHEVDGLMDEALTGALRAS